MKKKSTSILDKLTTLIKSPQRGKEADLAAWSILRCSLGGDHPITESEFAQKLVKCGVPFKDPSVKVTRTTGDLKAGEYASIDKNSCEHPENQDVCSELHNTIVLITKIVSDGKDCTISVKKVDLEGNPYGNELSFNGYNGGAPSGKKVGLYRHAFQKPIVESEDDGNVFELVYIKDKTSRPSPQYRIEQTSTFVQEATKDIDNVLTNSEKYLVNYYQGRISSFTESKEGQKYCTLLANKSRSFAEGIGGFVNINPNKGSLYYIGLVGKRPNTWLGELLSLMAKDNKPIFNQEWEDTQDGTDVY